MTIKFIYRQDIMLIGDNMECEKIDIPVKVNKRVLKIYVPAGEVVFDLDNEEILISDERRHELDAIIENVLSQSYEDVTDGFPDLILGTINGLGRIDGVKDVNELIYVVMKLMEGR